MSTTQVGVRLSNVIINLIDNLIKTGFVKNRADFVEKATIEYLRELKIINIDNTIKKNAIMEELNKIKKDNDELKKIIQELKSVE